jgi:DNA-directed RNA polymerase subunit RPC12/RpoP
MFKEGCPGSAEIRSPSPEDITCFWCDARNEIWSDESEMKCKNCGKQISRDMKPSCIMWCPAAKECVGVEKYERLMKAMIK